MDDSGLKAPQSSQRGEEIVKPRPMSPEEMLTCFGDVVEVFMGWAMNVDHGDIPWGRRIYDY